MKIISVFYIQNIILWCVGYIFKCHPPTERNGWYGYRTKKSMANDRNWIKAQKQYGIYSLKYLWVLLLFGIIGLVIEIVGIMRSTDIIIMTGLGIELVVMLWYMFIVYWKVEKAL
ncbi:SdpI family protein [Staphylococcus haemolyticus]|nr:SdpI family protein [Staphylococcus haemolyticus]